MCYWGGSSFHVKLVVHGTDLIYQGCLIEVDGAVLSVASDGDTKYHFWLPQGCDLQVDSSSE